MSDNVIINPVGGKYGTDQLVKVVDALASVINVGGKMVPLFKEGGFWVKIKAMTMLLDLAGDLAVLGSVDFPLAVSELRDMDAGEQDTLYTRFAGKCTLNNPDVEMVVEAIFRSILKGVDFVDDILALIGVKETKPTLRPV